MKLQVKRHVASHLENQGEEHWIISLKQGQKTSIYNVLRKIIENKPNTYPAHWAIEPNRQRVPGDVELSV